MNQYFFYIKPRPRKICELLLGQRTNQLTGLNYDGIIDDYFALRSTDVHAESSQSG